METKKLSNTPQPDTQVSRRRLFVGAGAAGAAGVLAVAASAVSAPEEVTAAAQTTEGDGSQGGYRLTPHVLRYYQTAKV